MKILLVVDLQPEFKDKDNKYEEILDFVRTSIKDRVYYDKVIATKCLNKENSNFVRYSDWTDLISSVEDLEFTPDKVIEKIAYGLTDYSFLDKDDEIHIIGFNTGACVLKIALDLFDRDYNFKVLSKYCYSSNGLEHHNRGMWTLKHLIGNAVV